MWCDIWRTQTDGIFKQIDDARKVQVNPVLEVNNNLVVWPDGITVEQHGNGRLIITILKDMRIVEQDDRHIVLTAV